MSDYLMKAFAEGYEMGREIAKKELSKERKNYKDGERKETDDAGTETSENR